MPAEYSCGAVVFTRANGERRYVIIREKEGFCGFPKGHMEEGETERERPCGKYGRKRGCGCA